MTAQIHVAWGTRYLVAADGRFHPVPQEILDQVDGELTEEIALARYARKVGFEVIPADKTIELPSKLAA